MSIIVANWKMNLDLLASSDLVRKILDLVDQEKIEDKIVICPSFTMLDRTHSIIQGSSLKLGAQDSSAEPVGSRTGEVSASMLKDVGCEYVILGHSERREFHDETVAIIRRKVKLAHAFGLKTVICIGETKEERMSGSTLESIKDQLFAIVPEDIASSESILIAYEPLWAIGTGVVPSAKEISVIAEYCAGIFATRFSFENRIKFLYGGSVNASNCAKILDSRYVDGILVGGASLEFKSFSEILRAANKLCKQY